MMLMLGLLALTLALPSVSGCGSDSSSSATSSLPQSEQPLSSSEAQEAHGKATLQEVNGSGANGVATFAPGGLGDTRSIRIKASGLQPTGAKSYAGWLTGPSGKLLTLATFQVGKDGKLDSEFEIAAESIELVEDGTLDEVLLTQGSLAQMGEALEKAAEPVSSPGEIGAPVMRGAVTGPIIAAANN